MMATTKVIVTLQCCNIDDDDDDDDDDVCEQMSRVSEGVHSLAPIGLFLPLPPSLPPCLDLILPGPYRRSTNPPSLPI